MKYFVLSLLVVSLLFSCDVSVDVRSKDISKEIQSRKVKYVSNTSENHDQVFGYFQQYADDVWDKKVQVDKSLCESFNQIACVESSQSQLTDEEAGIIEAYFYSSAKRDSIKPMIRYIDNRARILYSKPILGETGLVEKVVLSKISPKELYKLMEKNE